mmetsp:Transcript_5305/g.5458  ORF Transcript_5305/g.5458 Transcript_5305/m.5458 type:complete len:101 (-) Transcript_5305:145-447(-)
MPFPLPASLEPKPKPRSFRKEQEYEIVIGDSCKAQCTMQFNAYSACIGNIGKTTPDAPKSLYDCEVEFFDYFKCLDKCASHIPHDVIRHIRRSTGPKQES